jgi:hypothetical protein
MMYQDPYTIVTDKENREREKRETKNERRKQNKRDKTHDNKDDDIITEIKDVPVTVERKVPHNLSESLGNAGL